MGRRDPRKPVLPASGVGHGPEGDQERNEDQEATARSDQEGRSVGAEVTIVSGSFSDVCDVIDCMFE